MENLASVYKISREIRINVSCDFSDIVSIPPPLAGVARAPRRALAGRYGCLETICVGRGPRGAPF